MFICCIYSILQARVSMSVKAFSDAQNEGLPSSTESTALDAPKKKLPLKQSAKCSSADDIVEDDAAVLAEEREDRERNILLANQLFAEEKVC